MSLVHLKKSVVTLHLREMVEDGQTNDRFALFGLGAFLLSPLVAPTVTKVARKVVKDAIKSGLSMYEQSQATFAGISEEFADNLAESQTNRGN